MSAGKGIGHLGGDSPWRDSPGNIEVVLTDTVPDSVVLDRSAVEVPTERTVEIALEWPTQASRKYPLVLNRREIGAVVAQTREDASD